MCISKILNEYDVESKVLSFNKIDKLGILKFYKYFVDLVHRDHFIDYYISEAKEADIIDIHSMKKLSMKIREIFGNSKKNYFHFHATDLRGREIPDYSTINKMKIKMKFFYI